MKSGRAAKWAEHIFLWEEKHKGYSKFLDWEEFQKEFQKDFCPAHADVAAINKLESTSYYQKSWSVDDYQDEFVDLIAEAGYTDPKTTVVKFQKGLDLQIQNTIATMAYGRPSNASLEDWYEVAKNVDQNRAANEVFKSACQAPGPIPTHLTATPICVASQSIFHPQAAAPAHSTPSNHISTDIDGGQQKNLISLTCYRCHQPSHKVPDCPLNFDIRSMTIKELEKGYGKSEGVTSVFGRSYQIRGGFCTKQQVTSTPSLSTCNHFKILSNIQDSKTKLPDVQKPEKTIKPLLTPSITPITPKVQKQKWEKALPEKYTISAIGESNSLKLKVELETTDTSERKSINSLVDSRATGEFINCDYAKSCRFNLLKLTHPSPVYNIDGSPNKAGSITKAVSLILQYKNHSK